MIVRAAITSSSSQPPALIDDERVQRREKVVRCLLLLHWLHTLYYSWHRPWVLGSVSHMEHGYWQPPEQLIHEDAIPHLQVVKEVSALWLVSCDKSRSLIGWCWTHLSPGSRQWVIISAFGLDLAAMPNINRIHRLYNRRNGILQLYSALSQCGAALSAPKWIGDPGI